MYPRTRQAGKNRVRGQPRPGERSDARPDGAGTSCGCRVAVPGYHLAGLRPPLSSGRRSTPVSQTSILVVDDEPSLLDLLELALEEWGYRVLTARDGASALDVLSGARVELLVPAPE